MFTLAHACKSAPTYLEIDLLGVRAEHPIDAETREFRAVLAEAEGENRHQSRRHFLRGGITSEQEPLQTPFGENSARAETQRRETIQVMADRHHAHSSDDKDPQATAGQRAFSQIKRRVRFGQLLCEPM